MTPTATTPSVAPEAEGAGAGAVDHHRFLRPQYSVEYRCGPGWFEDINDVITAVEPRLWSMSTVLQILQDTTIAAAGPSVHNVSLAGPVPVGIAGAARRRHRHICS